MQFTNYFLHTRQRPDRAEIKLEWIEYVFNHPEKEQIQADGRIRRWAKIEEVNKYRTPDSQADYQLVIEYYS